jgi:hypothetical protein
MNVRFGSEADLTLTGYSCPVCSRERTFLSLWHSHAMVLL